MISIAPRPLLHTAVWLFALAHLLLAALLPLAAHEAHYALYARHLQVSYLDHPPLAPWLQSLVLLVSDSDLALRVLPIGLSVVAMYLLARLARGLYPEAPAALEPLSVLLLGGTLVFHASMTLSPDAPLVPLGILALICTSRCLTHDRWRDWLALGVVLGLAGLAKYTAITLAVSVLLACLLNRGPRVLRSGRLWLAGVVALVLISPVLWWNWQHDWATVAFHRDYQFEDVEAFSGAGILVALLGQVGYYSPVIVLGGMAGLWSWLRAGSTARSAETLVAVFTTPVLLTYLVAALGSRASLHWSILGWVLLIPMVAHWILSRWRINRAVRALTRISVGYALTIVLAVAVIIVPVGRWPDFRHPLRLVLGWQEAARFGDRLLADLDDRGLGTPGSLLARNWHHAPLLAWYAPDTPVLNLFHDFNPYSFRYGLSGPGTWGVLVYPQLSRQPRMKNLTRNFDCTPIDALPIRWGQSLVEVFHFYACYWHGSAAGGAHGRQSARSVYSAGGSGR